MAKGQGIKGLRGLGGALPHSRDALSRAQRTPSPDRVGVKTERGDLIWKFEMRPAVAGRAYARNLEFEKREF